MFSEGSVVPGSGDFVLGNRRVFFTKLIPHAEVTPRIKAGHNVRTLIYYLLKSLCSNKSLALLLMGA